MKIFANIPGALKLVNCLKYLEVNKKAIEDANASGDFEKEREYILKSTSYWGPMVLKMFGSTLNVKGIENLPDKGPVVPVSYTQLNSPSGRSSLSWVFVSSSHTFSAS